jgi:hypothetical protein
MSRASVVDARHFVATIVVALVENERCFAADIAVAPRAPHPIAPIAVGEAKAQT